jgi:sigma-E factor negative regulatory protein RseB
MQLPSRPSADRLAMMRRFIAAAFSLATAFVAPEASAADALDVPTWLARVHDAAMLRNYQGTQVLAAGGVMSSSHIAHFCEGAQQYERVDMLDGQQRAVLRHNDMVYTVWPQRQIAIIEQREMMSPFPSLLRPRNGERLGDRYEVSLQGTDRQADHEADVFLLKPRDELRFAQRMWTDRASGLLLRADVLGPHGEVLESSAFSEVAIGGKAQPDAVLVPLKQIETFRLIRPAVVHTRLEAEGWDLKREIPGFREISCIRRQLDALSHDDDGPEMLQAIFSDGLTHISLFIEPYDPKRHHHASHSSIGATHTLMGRLGDAWVTVVGDVPIGTLKQFANALERRNNAK